jgi:hypothetical protein
MAYNFGAGRERARRQILKYGHENELFISGRSGAYNAQGGKITASEDVAAIRGICTSIAEYDTKEIDGKNILSSDGWVYFDSEEEPKQDMLITINGKKYRVISIKVIESGLGSFICRKLQIRGA